MKLKELLASVAPTLATALLGPVGGLAVEALGKAFGIEAPTVDKLEEAVKSGSLTGEQIVAAKAAELAFTVRCKELDIDLEKIHAGDRDSARKMQSTTGSKVPAIMAVLVTVGFFAILLGMLTGHLKTSNSEALLVMLGALGTAWGAIVQFYFGSSIGSHNKDAAAAAKRA